MKILVINAGSSSLKYQLFDMQRRQAAASGVIERIGEDAGAWTHVVSAGEHRGKIVQDLDVPDHRAAMLLAVGMITDPQKGVISDASQIDAVGHRVVQGGEAFNSAVRIDEAVKQAIRDNNPLAPLHTPPNLTGIEVSEELLPGIPNIAVFDTVFHQTMPPRAFLYAIPYEFYSQYGVRRYGFHGTSHKYVAAETARLMNKSADKVNMITVHLGNGCSISAVQAGKCIDTSMGMTPLAGVMMGTRSGNIDPAIIGYLLEHTGMDIRELETVLNKRSGLKGICGLNDFRDIHEAAGRGEERAALAVEMFCYQVKKKIGAYVAALGTVDALVFTAGIGENDAVVRAKICENLSGLGIKINQRRNDSSQVKPFSLHAGDSGVQVWVVPTNEELQIAKEVLETIKQQ